MNRSDRGIWGRRAWTAAIGLLGTAVFWLLGMPLPFLLGPLAACLITALMGARLSGPPTHWLNSVRTILGVAAGSSVSPSLMEQLPLTLAKRRSRTGVHRGVAAFSATRSSGGLRVSTARRPISPPCRAVSRK